MKIYIRTLLLFSILFSGAVFAYGQPYQQSSFNTLLQQGKPVLLHVHAAWCPVCRAQDKVLSELMTHPEFKGLAVLEVDFDQQKPIVKALKVNYQSTLILYGSGKEVNRLAGETDSANIAAFLKTAKQGS